MTPARGRPKRSLGQNFLVDPNYQRKVVASVPFADVERVIEIGPGRGAITEGLLLEASALVVIEKDPELAALWLARAKDEPRLVAVEGDVLHHPISTFGVPSESAVVGNIPYNLTTPILFHLLERPRPRVVIVMVQREVAQRLVADPGTAQYGALSVGVQSVATVEQLFRVPSTAFRPRPRVESAVLRVLPHRPAVLDEADEAWTRRLTRAAFGWRRKQLGKILRDHTDIGLGIRAVAVLERMGVSSATRPEALTPTQFVQMARAIRSEISDSSRTSTPD